MLPFQEKFFPSEPSLIGPLSNINSEMCSHIKFLRKLFLAIMSGLARQDQCIHFL